MFEFDEMENYFQIQVYYKNELKAENISVNFLQI